MNIYAPCQKPWSLPYIFHFSVTWKQIQVGAAMVIFIDESSNA